MLKKLREKLRAWLSRHSEGMHHQSGILFYIIGIIYYVGTGIFATIVYIIAYAKRFQADYLDRYLSALDIIIGDEMQESLYAHRYGFGFGSVALILVPNAVRFWIYKRKFRSLHNIDPITEAYAAIISKIRIAQEQLASAAMRPQVKRHVAENAAREIYADLINMLDDVSSLYRYYSGRECHSAVKLYKDSSREVRTAFRDSASTKSDRGVGERQRDWYPLDDNSVFSTILQPNGVRYFLCNHLRIAKWLGIYHNNRKGWDRDYTSILCVPITYYRSANHIEPNRVWGFLLVDSRRSRFDHMLNRILLSSFARIVHHIFWELSQIELAHIQVLGDDIVVVPATNPNVVSASRVPTSISSDQLIRLDANLRYGRSLNS